VDLARSDYMTKVGANLGKLDAVFDHSSPPAAPAGEPLQ
jgi:glycerol-3-phosphate acyltransferase PlsX